MPDPQGKSYYGAYVNVYRRQIDEDSRRILIPSDWRDIDPAPFYTVLSWPIISPIYMAVLPPARWNDFLTRISSASSSGADVELLQQLISYNASRIIPDGNGRVVLPEDKVKALGIKNEVVLAGRLEFFEVWEPESFYNYKAKIEGTAASKSFDIRL